MTQRRMSNAEFDALLNRLDPNREISPDANGYVLEVNGVAKGYIKVDASAQTLEFLWLSASEAWPSTFDLVPPSGSTPTTTHTEVYAHAAFPSGATSIDISSCQYRIVQGSSVIGYLYQDANGLAWYATPNAPVGGYFAASAMTFKANTDTGSHSVLKVYDAKA